MILTSVAKYDAPSNAQQTAVCIEPPSCEESPPLALSLTLPYKLGQLHFHCNLMQMMAVNSSQKTPSSGTQVTNSPDSILCAQLHGLKQFTNNLVCLDKNISGSTSSFFFNKSLGKSSKNNATIDKEM